jgi:hypothetical protein
MSDPRFPLRPEYRDYQLAREFGWTKAEIDEQPAVWLDWLLAIHSVARQAEISASYGET